MPTFTNKATLSYNGRTIDSNTVTGSFDEALSIEKTALLDRYGADGRLVYIVSLVNAGGMPLSGLTLTDDLGAYPFGAATLYPLSYVDGSVKYYQNGVLSPAPTVTAGPPLTISGISVPAGGTALVLYEAAVTPYAPLDADASIENTVAVGGLAATETVFAVQGPELTIAKSICPAEVGADGQLTYTFVIQNTGNTPAVATDNLVVSDVFAPALTLGAVTLDGEPLALGTGYTYDEATGEFSTVESVITVPAATYTQEADGSFTVVPGVAVLTVTGRI